MRFRTPVFAALVSIALLFFFPACGPREAGGPEAQLDALFQDAARTQGFTGNVLITRDGKTLYEKSFGLADLATAAPHTAETKFIVYSLLKPFTAVLILQQMEAGTLRLESPLTSFFPELAGKPAGAITLHQLLTHTSGIEEVISRHRDRRLRPADLATATIAKAGEFAYSNTGFVILALVLEKATARSYEALLQERILVPAGMVDSGLLRSGRNISNLATGYRLEHGQRIVSPLDVPPETLDGAGSLYVTARDLARFDQALTDHRLLTADSHALMVRDHVKGRFGYGWFLAEQGGRDFPWHEGGYRGFTAVLVRQIHRHEMIAILANTEDASVLELRTKALRILKAAK